MASRRSKLRSLIKRAKHLHDRINNRLEDGKDISFDSQEYHALRWAITELNSIHDLGMSYFDDEKEDLEDIPERSVES